MTGRSLPDFSARPTNWELFPPELRLTFEGKDVPESELRQRRGERHAAAGRALAKGKGLATPGDLDEEGGVLGGRKRALEMVGNIADEEADEDEADYDQEAADGEDEDVEFDDEDAGDYDAELYFDGGDGFDDGDDGGGEDAF